MHRFVLVVFAFVFACVVTVAPTAQTVETATIHFTQTIRRESTTETVHGMIYLVDVETIVTEVLVPSVQYVVVRGNETITYYPDSNEAFIYTRDTELIAPMDIRTQFMFQQDRGLSAMGYKLESMRREHGSVVSIWKPPVVRSEIEGVVELVTDRSGNVTEFRTLGRDGTPHVVVAYEEYVRDQGRIFPKRIITSGRDSTTGAEVSITVEYHDVDFAREIPPRIREFRLPEDSGVYEFDR